MAECGELVKSLRDTIDEQLRPHIVPGEKVAFVHFPNHRNPGDAAIALGAMEVLARSHARVAYICTRDSYRAESVRRAIDGGTIFLNGGGNLGDRWPWEHAFREEVIADFPGNPIVQLPQSMNFTNDATIEAARRGLDHQRLTILYRDRASYEQGTSVFAAPAKLCPDLAFAYRALPGASRARSQALCVGRLDSDSAGQIQRLRGPQFAHGDWPFSAASLSNWLLARIVKRMQQRPIGPRVQAAVDRTLTAALPIIGRAMVNTAIRHLGRYAVVVTDRLHAHIFATLLGIPQVLVDTRDRKLSAFYETWTSSSASAHLVSNAAAVAERANEMLRVCR